MADSFFQKLKSLKPEDEQEYTMNEEPYKDAQAETEQPADYDPEAEGLDKATPENLASATTLQGEVEEDEEEGVDQMPEKPTATLAVSRAPQKTKVGKRTKTQARVIASLNEESPEEGRLTIDVYETPKEIVVKSTVAGVDPEHLDINITTDSIAIRGTRHRDEEVREEDYFYQETFWGAFSRSVILPVEIDPDKAEATLDNGILTIRLPKLSKTQQKRLQVKKLS